MRGVKDPQRRSTGQVIKIEETGRGRREKGEYTLGSYKEPQLKYIFKQMHVVSSPQSTFYMVHRHEEYHDT